MRKPRTTEPCPRRRRSPAASGGLAGSRGRRIGNCRGDEDRRRPPPGGLDHEAGLVGGDVNLAAVAAGADADLVACGGGNDRRLDRPVRRGRALRPVVVDDERLRRGRPCSGDRSGGPPRSRWRLHAARSTPSWLEPPSAPIIRRAGAPGQALRAISRTITPARLPHATRPAGTDAASRGVDWAWRGGVAVLPSCAAGSPRQTRERTMAACNRQYAAAAAPEGNH